MSLQVIGDHAEPFSGRAWVRTFPHGEVEVLYRSGDAPSEVERLNNWLEDAGIDNRVRRLAPPGFGSAAPKEKRDDAETNAERSLRRAKQAVRWAVKAVGCDQMLTLTYRENVTDYAESRAHLSKFLRLCRAEWSSWKHVAAPEQQKRGAWHWHIGVRGFVNYDKLRGFWWKAMGYKVAWSIEGKPILLDGGDTPGNVQGVPPRVRGRTRRTWTSDRMSQYMSKYIAKSFDGEAVDGKRYSVSRGLVWKVERYAVRALQFEGVATSVFSLLSRAGVACPFLWQSPERAVLWAAGTAEAPS